MHITVEHTELLKTLEIVARVSTKHVTLPVLQCVLLEVKNNTLTVKATNLEIGVEGVCKANVKETGSTAVPAAALLSIISLISEKDITLSLTNDVLTIKTKHSSTKLNTIPHNEFPNIPKLTDGGQKVNREVFLFGIKTTAFAASQSSIKPELGSIYIYQKKAHTLTFVATDSFRLIEKTVPQQNVNVSDAILIPQKNAIELARTLEALNEDPQFFVTENQCALAFSNVYITSRLTNGTFPDYEQIIPKEYATHATLLTKDLVSALKKTNIFLNKFLQLTLKVENAGVTLTSQTGEIGSTEEYISASVDGEPLTLNFNQRYISEILPYVLDDSLTLHFAGIGRPLVIESVHDTSLRYLVMPMNK